MGQGFFPASKLTQTKAPSLLIPQCGACGLYKKCLSPKMPPSGEGRKRILIVAEAPGKEEDKAGRQLVGNSGRELMQVLARYGVDMRKDCWLTNALICRPPDNVIKDLQAIDYCRPNLTATLQQLQPEIIIPIGGTACTSLLAPLWREDVGGITKWAGFRIPSQKLNAWICPTYHPSYLLHEKNPILDRLFAQHLQAAIALEGRPWDPVPDYASQVELLKPSEAARLIKLWTKKGGTFAFDYETNMLRPEPEESRIVSCSVCRNGKRTVAFPWHGEVIEAMGNFLASPWPKIASNLKFEDRWTRHVFGWSVRNWVWDTMLAAHVLDYRPDITSIKFQSFVWLGFPAYDEHIKPYLKTKGSATTNRILQEIALDDLLLYNGLDSLLEYHVAMKQIEAMKYPSKYLGDQ